MSWSGTGIYILATGEIYQKLKHKKILYGNSIIDMTPTYGIAGPLPGCAAIYFLKSGDWKCFNTLEEAREAASKL